MSLGAGETTLLKMVAGYATFANGGKQVRPTLIDRIQDRWGRTVWRHDQRSCPGCKTDRWAGQAEPEIPDDKRQIIDPHTAYQMTSMLEGVVQSGTATIMKKYVGDAPLAGKTGTTNDSRDTWFVGYTPDMVVGVYVGYDTPRPMGKAATGGQVSAPIVGSFLKLALQGTKPVPFRVPPGIKLVRVNHKSGLRAERGDRDTIIEAFKPFEEPDDPNSFLGYEGAGATSNNSGDRSYGETSRNVSSGRGRVY